MSIVIFHNPNCGTSRNVLRFLQETGNAPEVIHYLKEGWTRSLLLAVFSASGLTARAALRETKSPAQELGLMEDGVSEEQLISAMLAHPILVNRPFVCSAKGVRLCRPSEAVLDLLPTWPAGPLTKEDGQLVLDKHGNRTQ